MKVLEKLIGCIPDLNREAKGNRTIMEEHICESCGVRIPSGSAYYRCRTEIVSGVDAHIPESQLKDPDALIREACKSLAGKAQKEVMAEVYEEISFVICPACRLKIRRQLLAVKYEKEKKGKVLLFPPQPPL